MKRSNAVTLGLMGTASFAASFAAGSTILAWTRPLPTAPAATAAAVQAGGAMARDGCTLRPDGTKFCRSSPGIGATFLVPGSVGRTVGPDAGTAARTVAAPAIPVAARAGLPETAVRGGFGATGSTMAQASAGS